MKYLIKVFTSFLFVLIVLNGFADDPYCKNSFNGNVIASNPSGSLVYSSPDINSSVLFTLPYNKVLQACWWDTFRDTVNNTPGNWRKVKNNNQIGYIFSTDCFDFDTSRYEPEKIVPMLSIEAISYKLSDKFFGVFETKNGDSLLMCHIELKRFTTNEINDYNKRGSCESLDHNWHYVTTDKPYKCKLLFTSIQTLSPQKINQFTYAGRLIDFKNSFEIKSQNCEISNFAKIQIRNKPQSGHDIIDNLLFVRTGRNDIIDTVFYCNNCGDTRFINLRFEFLGDITGDKKIDFVLIRSGGEEIIRKFFISQGIKSRYKIINEY